jgi:hypothetical protein
MAWEEFPHSLGQKQTSLSKGSMSDLPSTADIHQRDGCVSFVPKADVNALIQSPPRREREVLVEW